MKIFTLVAFLLFSNLLNAQKLLESFVKKAGANPDSSVKISLRCGGTITNDNQPLIIIDDSIAKASQIKNLTPDDIKSIDVLKRASATAIYGSEGINGVVIIQTKWKKLTEVKIVSYEGRRRGCGTRCAWRTSGIIVDNKKTGTLKTENKISVYPNPVQRGSDFTLKLIDARGKYFIRLIDISGRILYTWNVNESDLKSGTKIHCSNNFSAGPLFIQIEDQHGRKLPAFTLLAQ